MLSLLVPCTVAIGPALMLASGDARALWIPVVLFYGIFPLIDWWLGEDLSNPPEGAVPALDADLYQTSASAEAVNATILIATYAYSTRALGTFDPLKR